MIDVRLLIDSRCKLGESPLWDERVNRLWWVDIEGRTIHRASGEGGDHESWSFPRRPTALGLTVEPDELAVAFEDGIYLWSRGGSPFSFAQSSRTSRARAAMTAGSGRTARSGSAP